ncbi:MAG: ABC transporter permease, partial [Spirochaetaceae bacterium]|nr:ABC transporter permease [Spirochaetaceae bacterium]
MKRTWVIRLAFKNLLRYKRRTLITAGAIAFGLIMYIWIDSILEGAADESVRNLRWYETADAMAAGPGYLEDRESFPLENSFAWEKLASELDGERASSTPRIIFGADLVFFQDPFPEDGNIPARVIAIDPSRDGEVFHLEDTIVKGRWLQESEDGVLLGNWLADDIGAELGAVIIAVTETRDGYIQTIDLEIVGILDSPNPVINREGVYITMDTANASLEMGGEISALYFTW